MSALEGAYFQQSTASWNAKIIGHIFWNITHKIVLLSCSTATIIKPAYTMLMIWWCGKFVINTQILMLLVYQKWVYVCTSVGIVLMHSVMWWRFSDAADVAGKRPMFDLQASLARPLTWTPHRGKLKPFSVGRTDVKAVKPTTRFVQMRNF